MLSKIPKSATSDSNRDSSVVSLPQNDKLSYPQRKLLCHSERYGESLHKTTRQSLSYCHSEGARSATEESLKKSLESQERFFA
ncbi:hypothetical protein [Helicobacter marmotae]|uniref:hypothetical protein n=1 Tax=Helicobacter marmotae TaxID=152490 RepID=UPI001315704E|nr:hypothetical protein [Helicobacter marmotae]